MIRTFLVVSLFSLNTLAADFQLFNEKGKAVRDYDKKVKAMLQVFRDKPGTSVSLGFAKGIELEVKYLGMGGQNIVLDLMDGTALRIRKRKKRIFSFWAQFSPDAGAIFADNLGEYAAAYKILSKHEVPVPHLYLDRSLEGEYLVVDKVDIEFDYSEYLRKAKKNEIHPNADKALIEFAKKTADFHDIGDFRGSQLVYNNKDGWILIDFTKEYSMANNPDDGNIFQMDKKDEIMNRSTMQGMKLQPLTLKPGLPAHMEEIILKEIEKTRSCGKLFQ